MNPLNLLALWFCFQSILLHFSGADAAISCQQLFLAVSDSVRVFLKGITKHLMRIIFQRRHYSEFCDKMTQPRHYHWNLKSAVMYSNEIEVQCVDGFNLGRYVCMKRFHSAIITNIFNFKSLNSVNHQITWCLND